MVNDREFAAVIALPAQERYGHFIKRVADSEQLWGLRSAEGWLLLGDDTNADSFPVWPAERYAAAYAEAQGCEESPQAIDLDAWREELLPQFLSDNVLVAVFPIPAGPGVVVTAEDHAAHLEHELQQYE